MAETKTSNASKRVANASTGGLIAIVLGWASGQYGVEVPQEVALAVGSLLGSVVSEVQKYVQEATNES